MQSMTYGTLPTRDEFNAAFERECPNGYRISLNSSDSDSVENFKLGDGKLSADELWDAITEIVNYQGDSITVSEDDEYENVYQVLKADTDAGFIEVGPDTETLISWANKFSDVEITSEHRAVECLNYASAYGQTGKCFESHDAAMDIVSSIMTTLNFEWI